MKRYPLKEAKRYLVRVQTNGLSPIDYARRPPRTLLGTVSRGVQIVCYRLIDSTVKKLRLDVRVPCYNFDVLLGSFFSLGLQDHLWTSDSEGLLLIVVWQAQQ